MLWLSHSMENLAKLYLSRWLYYSVSPTTHSSACHFLVAEACCRSYRWLNDGDRTFRSCEKPLSLVVECGSIHAYSTHHSRSPLLWCQYRQYLSSSSVRACVSLLSPTCNTYCTWHMLQGSNFLCVVFDLLILDYEPKCTAYLEVTYLNLRFFSF